MHRLALPLATLLYTYALFGGEAAPRVSRVAAVSLPRESAIEDLPELISRAADRGAEYVVTSEWHMSQSESISGPAVRRISQLAAQRHIWIALPIEEISPSRERHFQTVVLLNSRGEVAARYHKIVTSGDERVERGSPYEILESIPADGQRIGVVAGDDIQTGVPRLAGRGASTILVTAAWDGAAADNWRTICVQLSRRYRVNLIVASLNKGVSGWYRPDAEPVAMGGNIVVATIPVPAIRIEASLGLPSVPAPVSFDPQPELIELGRQMFFDPRLSGSGKLSCGSCHQPNAGFANRARSAPGVDGTPTSRNVPTLLNVAYRGMLFWDGLSSSLESQAKFPMTHAHEMNRHYLEAVEYVRSQPKYREAFRKLGREGMDYEDIAIALASYQRALISGNSAFDRYFYAGEKSALSPEAIRGLELFRGKANCSQCHLIGPEYALFMDQQFHNTGVAYDPIRKRFTDTGFGAISYQGKPGLFQTPSLRDVARTAPYMHDGSIPTLRDVVAYYNAGGRAAPNLDRAIKPLHLTARECEDLTAFLKSLDGVEVYSTDGRRMAAKNKVAAIDFTSSENTVQDRSRIDTLVQRAAREGAALVVLPERAGATSNATESQRYFASLAKRNGIWLIGTAPEVDLATHRTYRATFCFDPQGRIAGRNRKVRPDVWDQGIVAGELRNLEPVNTALGAVGMLSGADVMNGVSRLAVRGARLIVVPASWTGSSAPSWLAILKHLEQESGVTVVAASSGEDAIHTVDWNQGASSKSLALGLPPLPQSMSAPAETASIELGRRLFFDQSLSRDGEVSCAACHVPEQFFTNRQRFTPGVFGRVGKVNVVSLVNNGFRSFQTWEGKIETAEEQVRNALIGWAEMDMTEEDVVKRVKAKAEYQSLLQQISGNAEVSFSDISHSLANFVRTLVSGNSPFDRFVFANDKKAISEKAQQGLAVFRGKGHCTSCHSISATYALLSDNHFHNTGVGYRPYFQYLGYSGDGIEGNLVTKNKARGEYLTPTLRNVAQTAPYMHDGSLASLRDVVSFYNRGGNPNPFLDSRIHPLRLTESEQENLVAFLETLTGDSPAGNLPHLHAQGVKP